MAAADDSGDGRCGRLRRWRRWAEADGGCERWGRWHRAPASVTGDQNDDDATSSTTWRGVRALPCGHLAVLSGGGGRLQQATSGGAGGGRWLLPDLDGIGNLDGGGGCHQPVVFSVVV
uniref:Uncharacterized protein n=1 Tax=Oryza brachyantha TaxID=4533 RepID=J3L0V2_ORYBR